MVVAIDGREVTDWLSMEASLAAADDCVEVGLESGDTVTMSRSTTWRPLTLASRMSLLPMGPHAHHHLRRWRRGDRL